MDAVFEIYTLPSPDYAGYSKGMTLHPWHFSEENGIVSELIQKGVAS